MDFGEFDHFAQSLVHEDAAAVDGRTNGERGDEEDAQGAGRGLDDGEAIAEVAAERAAESFAIADGGESESAAARAHGLGDLGEGAPEGGEVGALRHVAEEDGEHGAGPCEEKVGGEARPLVDIFPAEEKVVLLEDGLDLLVRELLADGALVLVEYDAARLIEYLLATLPGHVAEVGVCQVEGFEERIEAAQFEEFGAVEGTASAAAVEAGEEIVDLFVDAMAHAQHAILPPALGEAGFFADLGGVAEEDLEIGRAHV